MNEELLHKAAHLQQESEEVEKQLQFVEQQIAELEVFSEGLKSLDTSKEDKVLASLGKGVYIPAQIQEKKLFVEVGAGVVVRKTPKEAQKVIVAQIKKFKEAQMHLRARLEAFAGVMQEMIAQVQDVKQEKK